jgi:hypothetical protein
MTAQEERAALAGEPTETLAVRIVNALGIGTAADFFAAKELFELTVGSAPIDGTLPADPGELAGFRLAQAALFQLRAHRKNLTRNGILWRGRPDFLTDKRLDEIRAEVSARRPQAVHDRWGQYLAEGGDLVKRLLESRELRAFVESHVGRLAPVGRASCIFYDQEGAYIRPHVDTDGFSVNANLILDHVCSGQQRSQLIVYPLAGESEPVRLQPGELVLFYADCIVHARTPLSLGERVCAISFGFQPDGEFHQ